METDGKGPGKGGIENRRGTNGNADQGRRRRRSVLSVSSQAGPRLTGRQARQANRQADRHDQQRSSAPRGGLRKESKIHFEPFYRSTE